MPGPLSLTRNSTGSLTGLPELLDRSCRPLAKRVRTVMRGFGKVMTIENNWNDPPDDPLISPDNRRYSSLATLLRARWLVDVDCWGKARGQPLKPGAIVDAALTKLGPVGTHQ